MTTSFARPLHTPKLVREFLQTVLQYSYDSSLNIEHKIVDGELGIIQEQKYNNNFNTYDFDDYRCEEYSSESSRWELRSRIVEELISLKRLDNDDEINLGNGGACPVGGMVAGKNAFLVIGLPASGKSTITTLISDNYNSLIIDSDYAKRKIPEFHLQSFGASLVNKESGKIVTAFTKKPQRFEKIEALSELALARNYNMVIPKIGNDVSSLLTLTDIYRSYGYKVHLSLVNLDRRKATIRAVERFIRTNRYVPLGMIFDDFGNDPILSYYILKSHYFDRFESFGSISTDVAIGERPIVIEYTANNPASLFT